MADSGTIITQPGAVFPVGPMPLAFPPTPAKADPKKEYLAGGVRARWPTGGFTTLAAHAEEAAANFGPELWELMDTEPTVSATLTTLAASIVCEGIQFYPALQSDPDLAEDAGPTDAADAELAQTIADYWERVAGDPRLDLQGTLFRWVRAALKLGVKLLETTYELATDGPDAGRLVPRAVKVKPNWAWSFVLDIYGNQVGLVGAVPRPDENGTGLVGTNLNVLLPRAKFAVLTFNQEDDDPRGHSVLRAAYIPWDEKIKLPKERWKFLSRFGTPTWVGKTAPDALDAPVLDSSGNDTGQTQSAQQSLYRSLLSLENATAIVGPAGSEIDCVEPKGDGTAFRLAADDCRREIVFAILCQIRATLESQYGSKADSESGQDILGTVVRALKHWVAGVIRRDLIYQGTKLNWGEDAARRLTPRTTLGRSDHQDLTTLMRAISDGWSKGLFFESMRSQVLATLGFSVPRNPGPPSGPVLPAGAGLGDPSSEPKPASPTSPGARP